MRAAAALGLLLVAALASCSDDADEPTTSDTTAGAEDGGDDGGGSGDGTLAVRLEATEGIFIEGFEVGLRFTDAATGDELDRVVWSEVAGAGDPYTFTYEQAVPATTVRVGADVNLGIGPGPEPPDLDADPMPCELDVEVPAGETVRVEVAFDDAADDCLRIVG